MKKCTDCGCEIYAEFEIEHDICVNCIERLRYEEKVFHEEVEENWNCR